MIYESVADLIGKTPLLRLSNISRELSLGANIIAKLEYLNPAGSVKDRAARQMLDDAEARGLISHGATIIEPTSGNTGIGLAVVGGLRGYRVMIVMPDSMSVERRRLLAAYGAELVLTDGALGMRGAIEEAERLRASIPGSFIPSQFTNPANADAHYLTTGPEIWEDTDGAVDLFVAGVGTGGTVTGVGKFLKEKSDTVHIVAVEPAASPMLTEGRAGAHGIQGIGANFVPDVLDMSVVDRVVPVSDDDAYAAARLVAKKEGILVGISSGAALAAAIRLAGLPQYRGKNIVVLLPDTGDRYLSTPLFN